MKISSLNKQNIKTSIKFILIIPIAFIVRNLKKNIWIVSERPNQARDNGYCFFKYIREKQPDCKAYYIIDQKSGDYQKIKELGNIIQYDSWKHYFYYCVARIHISAHVGGCSPSNSPICRRLKPILKYKTVFIPHGVSYGIAEFCLQKYAKLDLFICSGKAEYENVLKNYGYQEREVAYTGFPRLDQWHKIDVNKKQIVLMPTWRLYLAQNPNTVFEQTTYFKTYQSILQSESISEFLEKNDLELIFYPHHEMRKYVNSFETTCEKIKIAYNDDEYDIQELLKSSVLLITDYSSVHFDFAYMKKPVIYYQFDKKEFFEKQYAASEFDAEKNGFGPVVYEIDKLLEEMKRIYSNDFLIEQKYYDSIRKFYELHDDNNCKRVYDAICERCLI